MKLSFLFPWRDLGTQGGLVSETSIKNKHSWEENPQNRSRIRDEDSIFGFVFQHLEVFLLIGMGFMIFALFNTFTQFIYEQATFIKEPERLRFARTLVFGLMGVEVLLALATSYFRKRGEWAKSILVTAVALVIAYYNHISITEIFASLADSSEAVKVKLLLTNWLIFGLGEIVSLLMNSKGKDQISANPPIWFQQYLREQSLDDMKGAQDFPIPAQGGQVAPFSKPKSVAIGYTYSQSKSKSIAKRGPSIDYRKMAFYVKEGHPTKKIAELLGCSESSVRRFKSQNR